VLPAAARRARPAGDRRPRLVGAAFSAYLTYLELFVIEAICQWCVASAILMVCAAALACWRVLIDPQEGAPRRLLDTRPERIEAGGDGRRR